MMDAVRPAAAAGAGFWMVNRFVPVQDNSCAMLSHVTVRCAMSLAFG